MADVYTATKVDATGATSTTLSFDAVLSGNSQALVVFLAQKSTGTDRGDPVCTGVTYAGIDMTRVAESAFSNNMDKAIAFVLVDPPIGTADVVASFSGTTHTGYMVVIEVVNVNRAALIADSDARVGATVFITTSAVNAASIVSTYDDAADPTHAAPILHADICLDVIAIHGSSVTVVTPSAGQTSSVAANKNADNQWVASTSQSPSGSSPFLYSETFGYTVSSSTGCTWASVALTIRDEMNAPPAYVPYPTDVTDLLLNNVR